jgi:hypothetical protein
MRSKTPPKLLVAGLLAFGLGTGAATREAIKIGWHGLAARAQAPRGTFTNQPAT